ncbi:MAG: PAS domain-containing protein, partial [Anaerolineae bacterium]
MSVRRKLLLVVSITCIALVAGLYACACLLLRRTDLGSPLTAAVLLVGLAIVLLAVSLVLEAVALARTSRLAESIIAMAAKGDLSARMPVRGSSGLSRLGRAINALLEGLEQAERQRRAAEARAIQSRDFYLTLLDEFPALVWRTGADGSCDYVNKSWLAFCGRPSADILGDGWLASWHPEDRTRFVAAMQAALTERRPLELEHRLCRADGQYRWFVNIGRPFSNLDGE